MATQAPPIMLTIETRIAISLKPVFLVFILEATPTHIPLKYTCPSKISNKQGLSTLMALIHYITIDLISSQWTSIIYPKPDQNTKFTWDYTYSLASLLGHVYLSVCGLVWLQERSPEDVLERDWSMCTKYDRSIGLRVTFLLLNQSYFYNFLVLSFACEHIPKCFRVPEDWAPLQGDGWEMEELTCARLAAMLSPQE